MLPPLAFPDTIYSQKHLLLDLVVCYQPQEKDIDGWLTFIRNVIDRYGHLVHFLQITLEPNFNFPGIDGSSPGVREALTQGIVVARQHLNERGHRQVQTGFSVSEPQEFAGGDGNFWSDIASLGGPAFVESIDYIGLGLYPDAFSPVAPIGQPGDVGSLTQHALDTLRTTSLAAAGIPPSVPIHIAENGTPTGPDRTETVQADSLEHMIQTILHHRDHFNVTVYELFGLRDAESSNPDPFHQLGIMTDTYVPKDAYRTFRRLIASEPG